MLSTFNVPFAMHGLEHQLLTEQLADPKNIQRLLANPKAAKGLVGNSKALQALPAFKAKFGERLGIRDGIGFLYAGGPLFKRESWVTRLLGATTYEVLARDLQAALDHKEIQAIALYIDSPGGEANGCDELATAIYEARGKKPLAAYISGQGCSAAYWLATAAGRITASSAAMVGSVGVVVSHESRSPRDGITTHNFVSSQSPNKRGAPERIQKMVDDLASVFVSHVARHRGISTKAVINWRGGVEIGANAVKVGMVDAVGSFEDVVADLKKRPVPISAKPLSLAKPTTTQVPKVAAPQPAPVVQMSNAERARITAAAKAEAAELARIRAIFQSEEGRRDQERAAYLAYETEMSAEAAIAQMKSEAISASWRKAAVHANRFH